MCGHGIDEHWVSASMAKYTCDACEGVVSGHRYMAPLPPQDMIAFRAAFRGLHPACKRSELVPRHGVGSLSCPTCRAFERLCGLLRGEE